MGEVIRRYSRIYKATPPRDYKVLHTIADGAQSETAQGFVNAINALHINASLPDIANAIDLGSIADVEAAIGAETFNAKIMPMVAGLRRTSETAAIAATELLPANVQLNYSFDLMNPNSVSFIRNYAANLVTNISKSTRDGIRQIIANAFEKGGHPTTQARAIRNQIGLTSRQAIALDNYNALLISEGRPYAQVNRMVEKYRKRLLNQRATTIARTETINASNAGQQMMWQQAQEQGLLPMTAKKRWIVTPDDRLCPVCRVIPSMNPDGVLLNEPFQTPNGPKMTPTAHPNCRCAQRIISE